MLSKISIYSCALLCATLFSCQKNQLAIPEVTQQKTLLPSATCFGQFSIVGDDVFTTHSRYVLPGAAVCGSGFWSQQVYIELYDPEQHNGLSVVIAERIPLVLQPHENSQDLEIFIPENLRQYIITNYSFFSANIYFNAHYFPAGHDVFAIKSLFIGEE